MHKINIGIADDHSLFREGIKALLGSSEEINLLLEANSGNDLLEQLKNSPVDIVLLDIEMNDMNGFEVLPKLQEAFPNVKVIILSMHKEPRIVTHLMTLGANGYLQKDAKKEELVTAIREVAQKGRYLNDTVSNSMLMELREQSGKKKNLPPPHAITLSDREKEVLTLICMEYTTAEIAEKLFISERTVEGHRKNLCTKLDVKNTAGLVRKAIILKLIDPL